MGMYTLLKMNVEIKKSTPRSVIALLSNMVRGDGNYVKDEFLPDHPLFTDKDSRWSYMLNCDSAYFVDDTRSSIEYNKVHRCTYMRIQCNFKNYNNEVINFLDWIRQYIEAEDGQMLGYYRYEENDKPTLLNWDGDTGDIIKTVVPE
jgi:hypothetical protein